MARVNDKKKEEQCLKAWMANLPANSADARTLTGCDPRTIAKYYQQFATNNIARVTKLGLRYEITPQIIQQEALELVYVRLQAHKCAIRQLEERMQNEDIDTEELVSIANITKLNMKELST